MSEPIIIKLYNSPYGQLQMGSYRDQLCLCDWFHRKKRDSIDQLLKVHLKAPMVEGYSEVMEQATIELEEYFDQKRTRFSISLLPLGTDFQKSVWKKLLDIPYGETRSYLTLAKSLENTGAIRAVAAANGANPLAIFVPCHRVIGSDGSLTGYAGGLKVKEKLLLHEGAWKKPQMTLF